MQHYMMPANLLTGKIITVVDETNYWKPDCTQLGYITLDNSQQPDKISQ